MAKKTTVKLFKTAPKAKAPSGAPKPIRGTKGKPGPKPGSKRS